MKVLALTMLVTTLWMVIPALLGGCASRVRVPRATASDLPGADVWTWDARWARVAGTMDSGASDGPGDVGALRDQEGVS